MEESPLDKVLYEELTAKFLLSSTKSGLLGLTSSASSLQKQKLLLIKSSLQQSFSSLSALVSKLIIEMTSSVDKHGLAIIVEK